ncbi:MAG: 16S rRNA (cytidine(1402)-2'-O)-methyltransferase [Pseudomonadota bacterium]
MSGRLDIVATPIGNLSDAAPRLQETLRAADVVLAEDTRHSGRLLHQFGIKKPLFALHDHNEAEQVPRLIERLLSGERLALVSDAGTPTLSDPGFRLVRAAHAAGVRVSPVPGPCAIITALSVAGLATDRFIFEGFLPNKQAARRQRLHAIAANDCTSVIFEAVHRIEAMLADAVDILGEQRMACIARELTKRHEQIVRAPLQALQHAVANGDITAKGEFVVIFDGARGQADQTDALAWLAAMLAVGVPLKQAAKVVAERTGVARNVLYEAGLGMRT